MYNADNLRTRKVVNGTVTDFVWNGQNLASESTSNNVNVYTYDMTGVHIADKNGTVTSYVKDFHGNIAAKANAAGTMLEALNNRMDYDAFGNQWNGASPDPFGYCGEYYDEESGLIYLRNRYYDPAIGRFITEDPIRDGLNWYMYCGGNPIMFADPSGYITEEEQQMYENGEMAPGAYTYLMYCTYNYYLSDTDEDKQWWHTQAQNFRDSGYTDTGSEYWNGVIKGMTSRPTESPTKEQHFFRNELNIQFEWDDFLKLNERLPDDLKWEELPAEQSGFHKFGQINNRKYVSACGHFEVVYTKEDYLVDENFSAMNMGTYNYYGPNQTEEHKIIDVAPYGKWGNTPKGWVWSSAFE